MLQFVTICYMSYVIFVTCNMVYVMCYNLLKSVKGNVVDVESSKQ